MLVKKLNSNAIMPQYATEGSAGFDLCACITEPVAVAPGETKLIGTGLAFAVPPGHMMMAAPRSGLGAKKGIVLGNLVGIIDSDYRGEVMLTVWNRNVSGEPYEVQPGERVIQAIIVPVQQVSLTLVDELDSTERGDGGFGSTGK